MKERDCKIVIQVIKGEESYSTHIEVSSQDLDLQEVEKKIQLMGRAAIRQIQKGEPMPQDNGPWEVGATGKFPEGKLNNYDEGELRLKISKESNNVRIDFGKKISWLAFPKKDALALGNLLIKYAKEI